MRSVVFITYYKSLKAKDRISDKSFNLQNTEKKKNLNFNLQNTGKKKYFNQWNKDLYFTIWPIVYVNLKPKKIQELLWMSHTMSQVN
jgi:hypothetical protein